MVLRSKDCHNEVIITSLQGATKRPLKDNTKIQDTRSLLRIFGPHMGHIIPVVSLLIDFMVPDNRCNKTASLSNQY